MSRSIVSAEIPHEDLSALRALASADERSLSYVIRKALRNYLQNNEAAPAGRSANTSMVVLDDQS